MRGDARAVVVQQEPVLLDADLDAVCAVAHRVVEQVGQAVPVEVAARLRVGRSGGDEREASQ